MQSETKECEEICAPEIMNLREVFVVAEIEVVRGGALEIIGLAVSREQTKQQIGGDHAHEQHDVEVLKDVRNEKHQGKKAQAVAKDANSQISERNVVEVESPGVACTDSLENAPDENYLAG